MREGCGKFQDQSNALIRAGERCYARVGARAAVAAGKQPTTTATTQTAPARARVSYLLGRAISIRCQEKIPTIAVTPRRTTWQLRADVCGAIGTRHTKNNTTQPPSQCVSRTYPHAGSATASSPRVASDNQSRCRASNQPRCAEVARFHPFLSRAPNSDSSFADRARAHLSGRKRPQWVPGERWANVNRARERKGM